MSRNFRFLKRWKYPFGNTEEQYGWQILYFHIGRLSFNWFTECGDWYVYICWNGNEKEYAMRLSSAGNYVHSSRKGEEP